jgi:secreted PhoX family phosphatase
MKSFPAPLLAGLLLACQLSANELRFEPVPVPVSDDDKRGILSTATVWIKGQRHALPYRTLLRSGDRPPGSPLPFGSLTDNRGQPLLDRNGNPRVSNRNDFSSLLRGKHGELFMVSQFETRPGAIYLSELQQNPVDGILQVKRTRPLSLSHLGGGWLHCAGSLTPWNSHLGSEEYPPDARKWARGHIRSRDIAMVRYLPASQAFDDRKQAVLQLLNPYDYGHAIEIDVDDYDSTRIRKHYAMGRLSMEMAYVMPDRRTLYISDDGSHGGLFRFRADVAGDLRAGELFVAKWRGKAAPEQAGNGQQTAGASLAWISLGHASNAEIHRLIERKIGFGDIFAEDVPGCTAVHGGECLQLRAGMAQAAAFLETRRYAAMLGGTLEFEKLEGITHDADANQLYLAISRVAGAMSDNRGDIREAHNACGAIYRLELDTDFRATRIRNLLSGIPRLRRHGADSDRPYTAELRSNGCDLEGIAGPDNISFIPGHHSLLISEDSNLHQNAMVWAYNTRDDRLARIQTTPYGAEATSVYVYPDINGFAYIMSVVQHPFKSADQDKLWDDAELRGHTGYLGPLPALK